MATLAPFVESVRLTVDGGEPVDIHKRDYEVFSPQREVQLPADNILGIPAQSGTLSAWGWEAWLTNLPAGRHTLRTETTLTDGSDPFVAELVIEAVGKH